MNVKLVSIGSVLGTVLAAVFIGRVADQMEEEAQRAHEERLAQIAELQRFRDRCRLLRENDLL